MIQWCGLFYKLVKSIQIIAFGSKTGSNEHGNVPFSDFRFKLENRFDSKKSNYRSRDRIGLKLSCLTPLSRHLKLPYLANPEIFIFATYQVVTIILTISFSDDDTPKVEVIKVGSVFPMVISSEFRMRQYIVYIIQTMTIGKTHPALL